jgi:hypothetical protein
VTNREFAKTEEFLVCCTRAKTAPTPRQASKFRRKRGLAYDQRQQVVDFVEPQVEPSA